MLSVRVNGEQIAEIVDWEAHSFSDEMSLDIISDNFTQIKQMFSNIEKIEIISGENIIAEFTAFDRFESITYLGDRFIDRLNTFRPVLKVVLTKANIIEQVQRLDAKVNKVVDVESMTVEDFRKYTLNKISEECQADIFKGDHVTLEDGSSPNFSYTAQDQQDLKALCDTALQLPQMRYSWHPDGMPCTLYTSNEIVNIYATLQMKLLQRTTYCNALNQLVNNASTREEIGQYYYGCSLPNDLQENVNNIIEAMRQVFDIIMNPIVSNNTNEPNTESTVEPTTESNIETTTEEQE